MTNIKAAWMRRNIYSTNYRVVFIEEIKSYLYLKTATKVIKKPSKARDSSGCSFFHLFYVIINSYQLMESLPLTEDAIMTNWYSQLKGCVTPIRTPSWQSWLFPFDSDCHDSILAYIDINAVELDESVVRQFYKLSRITKKENCHTVNWFDHTITKL